MEAELEIHKSKERGHVGKRSTGEVSETTNKRGGTGRAMFLRVFFSASFPIHAKLNTSSKTLSYECL